MPDGQVDRSIAFLRWRRANRGPKQKQALLTQPPIRSPISSSKGRTTSLRSIKVAKRLTSTRTHRQGRLPEVSSYSLYRAVGVCLRAARRADGGEMRQDRAEILNGTPGRAADPSCECSWAAGCSCLAGSFEIAGRRAGAGGGPNPKNRRPFTSTSPPPSSKAFAIDSLPSVSSRRSRTR